MRKTLLGVCVLSLVVVVAASTSVSNNQSPAIRTYLLPDLSLKSVMSPDFVAATSTAISQTGSALAQGAQRKGTCRCSCGFPCTSDADCGGTSCDPFITCCDKNSDKDSKWFYQGVNNSSHKAPLPEDVLKKADCK